jgi:hypothetical protein
MFNMSGPFMALRKGARQYKNKYHVSFTQILQNFSQIKAKILMFTIIVEDGV